MEWRPHYKDKELIAFDLDGTLTGSKSFVDVEMAGLLSKLLLVKKVAIITGAGMEQLQKQILSFLTVRAVLKNLSVFPTCASSFYSYADSSGWNNVYEEFLTIEERMRIMYTFHEALEKAKFSPPQTLYGELIEDRNTQITFSGLGQEAPSHLKVLWDPTRTIRLKIKEALESLLPDYEVHISGGTSVDVTRKGIDKAYGISQIEKHLHVPKEKMLFMGDALFPGGNDYPVYEAGVDCINVHNHHDTKKYIQQILT